MTVDFTKLKAGDSVVFRNTGNAIFESISAFGEVRFKGYDVTFLYIIDTGRFDDNKNHPLDILEIIPAPFDWGKVEQGDAFEDTRGKVMHFISSDWFNKDMVLLVDNKCAHPDYRDKVELTPRPDIPNAKKEE